MRSRKRARWGKKHGLELGKATKMFTLKKFIDMKMAPAVKDTQKLFIFLMDMNQ